MTTKKELKLAYRLAGILLVVGILSYAASSAEPPVPFLRIMYQAPVGNVLFNHKAHFSPGDYSASCQDCHHDLRAYEDYIEVGEEGRSVPESSMDLANTGKIGNVELFTNKEEAHALCTGCHEEYEAGPIEENCNGCHVL